MEAKEQTILLFNWLKTYQSKNSSVISKINQKWTVVTLIKENSIVEQIFLQIPWSNIKDLM